MYTINAKLLLRIKYLKNIIILGYMPEDINMLRKVTPEGKRWSRYLLYYIVTTTSTMPLLISSTIPLLTPLLYRY